jgi:hypothetical protein
MASGAGGCIHDPLPRQPLSRYPSGDGMLLMKPDPDQTRWDRIDRRITQMRWLAAIILALLLGVSVLLLR